MAANLPALTVCLLASACFVPEGESSTVDLDVAMASQYVHRGMVMVDKPVLQPSVTIDIPTDNEGSIDLTVWGNMDLKNNTGNAWFPDGHAGKFSEVDLIGSYGDTLGAFAYQAGVHTYLLPNGLEFPFGERGQTSEVFLDVSTEVLEAHPILMLRYDYDEVEDGYLRGGIFEDFEISDDFRLRLEGYIGYSGPDMSFWNYGIRESGFSDALGVASLLYFATDRTTLGFSVSGSTIIDDTIRDWFRAIDIDPDNVWVSFDVRWTF